jgi:pimeloyl-ACP methyl ester carboxylesterase
MVMTAKHSPEKEVTRRSLLLTLAAAACAPAKAPESSHDCTPQPVNLVQAKEDQMKKVKNVVLIHGAWADGSCWWKIVPKLESSGLQVTAVQLPLTSIDDDVAAVSRALALVDGPTLLVAHSYGGAVMTQAGTDPKVVGLIYAASFAPDTGQSAGALLATVAPSPLSSEFLADAHGFVRLSRKGVSESFAQDLTEPEKSALFVAQHPTHGLSLGGNVTTPAWKTKPTWFIVAEHDRALPPDLQRGMADKIKAKTTSVASSHVLMLSHPDIVTGVIIEAAG